MYRDLYGKHFERSREELKIGGQNETIQTILRSAGILKRVFRSADTCYHSDYREKLPANGGVNIPMAQNNIYIYIYICVCVCVCVCVSLA